MSDNTLLGSPAWVGEILGPTRALMAGGQRILFSVDDLAGQLVSTGLTRPLVVVDRSAVKASRFDPADALGELAFVEFDGFAPNPTSDHAEAAARAAVEHRADVVVGIGGGSCCDVAKVAAIAAAAPERVRAIAPGGVNVDVEPLPLALVPTTSGTGCEATHFAAIYVDGRKVSVAHRGARAFAAVLDERFHVAMPQCVAATTGLDALCQACESTWAVGADRRSLRWARAAAELIVPALVPSAVDGDARARRVMMLGAHLAGRAINISKTTASHALSYQLTQRFGLAHGHAVALTLGHLALSNASVTDETAALPGGAAEVRARVDMVAGYFGVPAGGLAARMASMLTGLGLASSLADAGVSIESLRAMAERVDPVRLGNNPRRLDAEALVSILDGAWRPVDPRGEIESAA